LQRWPGLRLAELRGLIDTVHEYSIWDNAFAINGLRAPGHKTPPDGNDVNPQGCGNSLGFNSQVRETYVRQGDINQGLV
jgi:hypothetical protein